MFDCPTSSPKMTRMFGRAVCCSKSLSLRRLRLWRPLLRLRQVRDEQDTGRNTDHGNNRHARENVPADPTVVLVPDFAVAFLFDLMRRLPSLLTQLRAVPSRRAFRSAPHLEPASASLIAAILFCAPARGVGASAITRPTRSAIESRIAICFMTVILYE